jgi:hypothetical protein
MGNFAIRLNGMFALTSIKVSCGVSPSLSIWLINKTEKRKNKPAQLDGVTG